LNSFQPFMRGTHSKVGGKESGRPHLGHEPVGRLAVLVSPDGFSWDFGGRFFLQTESTQDGWRQHYVGNHVVRLLRQYLARRYDLTVRYAEASKKRGQDVKAPGPAQQNRSHTVL